VEGSSEHGNEPSASLMPIVIEMDNAVRFATQRENDY
jgi:hypothetical protein